MKFKVILYDQFSDKWKGFRNPVLILKAFTPQDVLLNLSALENYLDEGYYAVCLLSYEASPSFDTALVVRESGRFPLSWIGIFREPEDVNPLCFSKSGYYTGDWDPSISKEKYTSDIRKIKEYIKEGYTYQVNYSYRLYADFKGDPFSYFWDLHSRQKTDYAAYIDIDDFVICSVSPELFFRLDDDKIISKPMKGTMPRGRYLEEDEAFANSLRLSIKNRAENIMIVDMIRNDLGRIANYDTVKVDSYYDIEKFPTALQMTSTVSAKTSAGIKDIITALFPCSSITGAPKPQTMKIISELETTPRNIYTGSIGLLKPGRKAQFNVAIRTVLLDRSNSKIEFGTGGGIVWESEINDEYSESLTKAKVLGKSAGNFDLIETLLWTKKEGFFLLDYHMRRISDSAMYFDFLIDTEKLKKKLVEETPKFSDNAYKIRLTANINGGVKIESSPISDSSEGEIVRLKFADNPVDYNNSLLYHKTTDRSMYAEADKLPGDVDDLIFLNDKGEATETSIFNIVIRIGDNFFTPPVSSGLLRGTFRAYLLDTKKINEMIIRKSDIQNCDELFVINSVRKWRKAILD